MVKSVGYTFLFYIWMRALKQKGRKDFMYLLIINTFISLNSINYKMYSFPVYTKLPLTFEDLENRKELLEELVFSGSKSYVLTEEIKKISKFYVKEKIEYSYITSLGQKITFITTEGRMYLLCDNYAEVFGFTGKNKLRKINNLDVMNVREKEVVIGLFKFYDVLIDKYMDIYNIDKKKAKNISTKIFEEILKEKKIDKESIETLKNTKLLKNVEFDKIENINESLDRVNYDENKLENNSKHKNKTHNNEIKFYI